MRLVRPLTTGEITLARSIFGASIDYARVRIVRGRWWPFQPRGIAMAPTGNIHFHPHGHLWSGDFAAEHRAGEGDFAGREWTGTEHRG